MTLKLSSGERGGAPDRLAERESIMALCQGASVEMTVHNTPQLAECQAFLAPGSRIYVSYLPRQQIEDSVRTAVEVRRAGFDPVPHIPARRIASREDLDTFLARLNGEAGVEHVLLIAGDLPDPAGPFDSSLAVMQTGLLPRHGIKRVSLAGHPEGHPQVDAQTMRAADEAKSALAAEQGLDVTFVGQFSFEAEPILNWARDLRARGLRGEIRAGLAGPAKLTTLAQYAVRCGIGPSIRALGTHFGSLTKLMGERGPESVVRTLAQARTQDGVALDGIHLFTFGGLVRTCRWQHAVSRGSFTLGKDDFKVDE